MEEEEEVGSRGEKWRSRRRKIKCGGGAGTENERGGTKTNEKQDTRTWRRNKRRRRWKRFTFRMRRSRKG